MSTPTEPNMQIIENATRKDVRPGDTVIVEDPGYIGALQAFDTTHQAKGASRLTPTGRTLARLPVDPRLARMLIEAERTKVIAPVLAIVAAVFVGLVQALQHSGGQQLAHARDPARIEARDVGFGMAHGSTLRNGRTSTRV